MKCIKCGGNIAHGCCVKCGYLESGNFIKNEQKKSEYTFIPNYDVLVHNSNSLKPFVFGPFYLAYHGFVLLGTICLFFDISLFIFVYGGVLSSPYVTFLSSIIIVPTTVLVYWLLNRLAYTMFSNPVMLWFHKKKYERLKNNGVTEFKPYFIKDHHLLYITLILAFNILIALILFLNRQYF